MRSAWIGMSLVCLALATVPARAGEGPHLLADVNRERPAAAPVSDVVGFFELGDRLFFSTANPDGNGILWSSDGTADGTLPLSSSLCPIDCAGIIPLATWKGLAFLETRARDDSFQRYDRLARTDGTPEGTFQLSPDDPYFEILDVQASPELPFVYFIGCDLTGCRLWRSDGTASGTGSRITIQAGSFGYGLARVGNSWMFWVAGPDLTEIPWTVDGAFTRAAPLSGCGEDGSCPRRFHQFLDQLPGGGRLLVADDAAHGGELWVTDGTGPGTRRLTDVCPGSCSGVSDLYGIQTSYLSPSGEVYFHAFPKGNDNLPDGELWRTDGTSEGTYRIAESFSDLGFFQERAWFGTSHRFPGGVELWSIDGPPPRPRKVKVLHRSAAGSDPQIQGFRKGALLMASEGPGTYQLWRSDGTPAGTGPVYRFPAGERTLSRFLATVGPLQFLEVLRERDGNDPLSRTEIWRTDGESHTQEVADLGPGLFIDLWTTWAGKLLFSVSNGSRGCTLWTSDGTAAGTREILPQMRGVRCPTALVALGPRFLFVARVGRGQRFVPQVFLSDGTPAGTRQISAIREPREAFDGDQPLQVGGTVFFRLFSPDPDRLPELWRTDGTPEGTWRVSPLVEVDDLYVFRGALYFTADLPGTYGEDGRGLFRMALPGGSPVLLATVNNVGPFFLDPPVAQFTPAGNRLLFAARDEDGFEPWVTDGTPAGTHRLLDLQPGPGGSYPDGLVSAGGRAFFTADDGSHGRELWESDGTPEGTRMLTDLNPGGYSGLPFYYANLTVSNGYLFFAADDGKTGLEPWVLPLER